MFRTITQSTGHGVVGQNSDYDYKYSYSFNLNFTNNYDGTAVGQGQGRWRDRQEIGGQAVWTLSSAKPGFGVEQLRDDNLETYWQSDGAQPHTINLHFSKKSSIEEVSIYANYTLDESYTPSLISIKAGTTNHDLQEIKLLPIKDPTGWIHISLAGPNNEPLRTHFLQLAILSNHQNGRDTHLRQIKVYGPRHPVSSLISAPQFNTIEASAYSFLR